MDLVSLTNIKHLRNIMMKDFFFLVSMIEEIHLLKNKEFFNTENTWKRKWKN